MSLADHGVFGGIDDLAIALASEGDGVDRVAEGLLFRLTLGEIAVEMLDGDGHETLPVRYCRKERPMELRSQGAVKGAGLKSWQGWGMTCIEMLIVRPPPVRPCRPEGWGDS